MENEILTEQINTSNSETIFEKDFFEDLYSTTWLKQFTIAVFFIAAIGGLILEAGIIWYEKHGNHHYRTVINQLFSTISWLVVAYICFVYMPEGARYLIGPLNETFCDLHFFLKNMISNCILLTLDGIIFLRYIFIFKSFNFAVINDDLASTFLQMVILGLGFWMAAVKRMSIGKMPLNFFMCTGKDPSLEYGKDEPITVVQKYDTFGLLVVVSLVTNVAALGRIFLYQRKVERSTQKIELGRINPPGDDMNHDGSSAQATISHSMVRNMPKSMADLSTQALCILINLINVVVNAAIVRIAKIEPNELNKYENRWLVYYIQIIGIAVAILGISIQFYFNNRSSITAICRNFKHH